MEIIGIVGKKQSGKDTAGEVFRELGYTQYAFADPIKEMLKIMFLWSDFNFSTTEQKEAIDPVWGISPRQAMQSLGTDYGQYTLMKLYPEFENMIGRNIWTKRFEILLGASPDIKKWVITDVRFPHEVEAIHAQGGRLLKIIRPSIEGIRDDHESEAYFNVLDVDDNIVNDGSLLQFKHDIKEWIIG